MRVIMCVSLSFALRLHAGRDRKQTLTSSGKASHEPRFLISFIHRFVIAVLIIMRVVRAVHVSVLLGHRKKKKMRRILHELLLTV